MRRTLRSVAIAAVVMLGCGVLSAQDNPFVGTWKLNVEKSKFAGGAAPKSETRIVEAQGSGEKVTFRGVAADGSTIDFTFTTNLDGKPAAISGTGVPGGADTTTISRATTNTDSVILTKAGKTVSRTRVTVSADGKTTTITRRTTDAAGKPMTQVLIWDRQ
jgi:hypothetical protein